MNPHRAAAALILAALLLAPGSPSAQVALRNMQLLSHFDDFPADDYSACWSYVHGDGREYAILGTQSGTAFYNVTNPAAAESVGFIPGPNSFWREMKSYRNWVYIVTEGTGSGKGLQIVSMTDPQHPTLVNTYTTNFVSSHTVSVDTARAILICNGTRTNSGSARGMRVLSLADPESPAEVSYWPGTGVPVAQADYIHDCEPIGNRLYGSSIYSGIQRILDFTNPAAITEISQWTYPGALYTHSAWPDASGDVLYVTDETAGQPLRIFDISNPTTPALVNSFTPNPAGIVHNPRVVGDELYLANYAEGVRVLDIGDPVHPAEFAYADSWSGGSGGYSGVWEVCPYFPSGTVIASDIQSGLYVYRPVRNYGILRVRIEDQDGAPVAGIKVYLAPGADSLTTPADGIVQFAPDPGSYTVQAVRPGYPGASGAAVVTLGGLASLTITVPTGSLSGTVKSAATLAPLVDAEVRLGGGSSAAHTDASGLYGSGAVPEDDYPVEVHAPGYVPVSFTRHVGPGPAIQDFELLPAATWDALESDLGWTVGDAGDNATTGIWVRGDPVGTGTSAATAAAAGQAGVGPGPGGAGLFHAQHGEEGEGHASAGPVQPEDDRTPPPGTQCFVTGQAAPGSPADVNDVDGGRTSLTSPAMDLLGLADPVIGYWRWFYTRDADGSDWFLVQISGNGGASWVDVRAIFARQDSWEEEAIRVLDYVTPSSQVKVRFVAADEYPGGIVEAAVDDITTYEAGAPVAVGPPVAASRLAWRAVGPNPARAAVSLSLAVPTAGGVSVEVLDAAGRRVRTLHRGEAPAGTMVLGWDGTDDRGVPTPAGLYLVRAAVSGSVTVVRVVRVR